MQFFRKTFNKIGGKIEKWKYQKFWGSFSHAIFHKRWFMQIQFPIVQYLLA